MKPESSRRAALALGAAARALAAPPNPVANSAHHPERAPPPLARDRLYTPLILSAQEKEQLETLTRRHTAPRCVVQRARIILLAAQNMSIPAIADILQTCSNTVRKWIKRYTHNPQGNSTPEDSDPPGAAVEPPLSKLPLLADAPRLGRPDTFTAEQICKVIATRSTGPARV